MNFIEFSNMMDNRDNHNIMDGVVMNQKEMINMIMRLTKALEREHEHITNLYQLIYKLHPDFEVMEIMIEDGSHEEQDR